MIDADSASIVGWSRPSEKPSAGKRWSYSEASPQDIYDRLDDMLERLSLETADLVHHEVSISGEQLSWPRITCHAQRSRFEVIVDSPTARISPYGLLVIWHKIQLPRPTSASTRA